jgi:hypothetical protein
VDLGSLCSALRACSRHRTGNVPKAGACGLIHHNQASVRVLDMHNEYGFDSVDSIRKPVPGPREVRRNAVVVLTRQQRAPPLTSTGDAEATSPRPISSCHRSPTSKTTPTTLDAL